MIDHNKLVRDKIPQIIEEAGKEYEVRMLDDGEYLQKLSEKLVEEAGEYSESKDEEELADVLEVLLTLCEEHGLSLDDLQDLRKDKRDERGGFEEGVFLIEAEE